MSRRFKKPKPLATPPRRQQGPTDVVGYPEFAVRVYERFPDHCRCWEPLYAIANHIMKRSEAHHRLAVLLSTETAFNAFNGVILLALNGLGPEGMLVCRSLLETAMSTIYLAADPSRTAGYVAYANIVKHKIAKRWEAGERSDLIASTQADFDRECHRFPQKNLSWHQLQNDKLAAVTGFKDLYDDYYTLWSSVAHGDFLSVTARFKAEGHFQPPPAWEFVDLALEIGAEIAARLFKQVNALLGLEQDKEIEQVLAILDRIEPKRKNARRSIIKSVLDCRKKSDPNGATVPAE